MSVANSKQESRREIAERVGWSTIGNHVEPLLRGQLIDAIEVALNTEAKDRDERATKIADNHHPCQDGCYCGSDIATAIRNEDTDAQER